jgi:hypothetical protein
MAAVNKDEPSRAAKAAHLSLAIKDFSVYWIIEYLAGHVACLDAQLPRASHRLTARPKWVRFARHTRRSRTGCHVKTESRNLRSDREPLCCSKKVRSL